MCGVLKINCSGSQERPDQFSLCNSKPVVQVIAAGKPFQGNQLAPHMLTAQGKQVLQGQAGKFLLQWI